MFGEIDKDTTNENINIEKDISHTNHKINEIQRSIESPILANELKLKNQNSPIMESKDLNSISTNLYNGLECNFVDHVKDGFVNSEAKLFDLQKWIDNQIDSNSHMYVLDAKQKSMLDDKKIESFFDSKFNEKNSNIQSIIREHSGNKIPYKKQKDECLEGLKKHLYSKDDNVPSTFEKCNLPKDYKKTLDFEHNSSNEVNKSNVNLDTSTNEGDDDEPFNYEALLDDLSDFEEGLSLQELRSFNKNQIMEQLHLESNYNNDMNCSNLETNEILFGEQQPNLDALETCKSKTISKIPIEIKDKLGFDKTFFYDSVSNVQPYLQDTSEGPKSQPKLKVESARSKNIEDISPCSSSKRNLTTNFLKNPKSKKSIQSTKSLKEIDIHNNKPILLCDGFSQLPKETQEFLEEMKNKSSLRLSTYQQVQNAIPLDVCIERI